ncbi:hypothetical protein [Amycolatopsis sp. FDAARGOS 1241]|uniref:hypothetical protein n=1 Tax=Amycolatopsis sp. FDAARGOS 1241 TaxID=2778070 RepID=UPI001EF1DE62|nr:hypothetical protein [Amycolatopsis sp. FDAARGOS 1241]
MAQPDGYFKGKDGKIHPRHDPKGGGGAKVFVAGVALVAAVGSGGAVSLGSGAVLEGATGASETLPGNLAGDVADSLPGRSLRVRKSESQESARRGKRDQALSKLKLKNLRKTVRQEVNCLLATTGKVRNYVAEHRCTSLGRGLYAVGDGHGNAAIISVARMGFPTKSHAAGCERVEKVQGSGDITPLGGELLGLAGVHFTGLHFDSRLDGATMVVAEAETATGHMDNEMLDTLAEVFVWFPTL